MVPCQSVGCSRTEVFRQSWHQLPGDAGEPQKPRQKRHPARSRWAGRSERSGEEELGNEGKKGLGVSQSKLKAPGVRSKQRAIEDAVGKG